MYLYALPINFSIYSGAIKSTLQGIDLDLRVSSLPVSNGEKINHLKMEKKGK